MNLGFKIKFNKAQSSLEFIVVFIVLFLLFIGILDFGLFFKQIYLAQTISDEVLAKLQSRNNCSADIDATMDVMSQVVEIYSNAGVVFQYELKQGFHNFTADGHKFSLFCRNANTPDSVSYSTRYSGILFFENQILHSNYSSNTHFF